MSSANPERLRLESLAHYSRSALDLFDAGKYSDSWAAFLLANDYADTIARHGQREIERKPC